MTAGAVAKVIESSAPEYQKDDLVFAFLSWSDIILFDTRTSPMPLIKLPSGIDPSDFLALGLTAQTAYSGLLGTGKATSKDSVIVVSAAAGATGSSVAQIAKNVLGVKNVWGIAGGPEKCKIAEQSGCDRCFDYRSPSFRTDFEKAAREAGFVDVYFDNTGGISSDVVMRVMSFRGRVVVCGAISIYEKDYDAPCDISAESWRVIIYKQLRVEGFIVTQSFDKEWQNKAQQDLMQWAKEGKLKPLKDIWEAKFEEVPTGMQKLLQGKNVGKLITKIVDYAKLE